MDIVEGLMRFGLTRQESTLYMQLLTDGAMTGYEAAKATGISRSNAYTSLAGLVDKGAAYMIDGTPTRYSPVEAEEFLENKIHGLKTLKKELLPMLPGAAEDSQAYMTVKGTENIILKAQAMLRGAKQRIYISAESAVIQIFMDILCDRLEDHIKVVVLSERPMPDERMICHVAPRQDGNIGIITDSEAVLTGELILDSHRADDGRTVTPATATCLYSKKKNLVDLFKTSLSNEIKLIALQSK